MDVSIIERLVSFLKPFLVDYLDPVNDQIGVRLSQLNSVVYGNPTMDGFARTLVKMSAQIDSQHVANHFFSWTKGEPIRFQINALLKGVRLDKPFEAHGITLFNLPKDSRKVWQQLPFSRILPMQVTSMDLMGGIVISIESKVCPALYTVLTIISNKWTFPWERITSPSNHLRNYAILFHLPATDLSVG